MSTCQHTITFDVTDDVQRSYLMEGSGPVQKTNILVIPDSATLQISQLVKLGAKVNFRGYIEDKLGRLATEIANAKLAELGISLSRYIEPLSQASLNSMTSFTADPTQMTDKIIRFLTEEVPRRVEAATKEIQEQRKKMARECLSKFRDEVDVIKGVGRPTYEYYHMRMIEEYIADLTEVEVHELGRLQAELKDVEAAWEKKLEEEAWAYLAGGERPNVFKHPGLNHWYQPRGLSNELWAKMVEERKQREERAADERLKEIASYVNLFGSNADRDRIEAGEGILGYLSEDEALDIIGDGVFANLKKLEPITILNSIDVLEHAHAEGLRENHPSDDDDEDDPHRFDGVGFLVQRGGEVTLSAEEFATFTGETLPVFRAWRDAVDGTNKAKVQEGLLVRHVGLYYDEPVCDRLGFRVEVKVGKHLTFVRKYLVADNT